MKVNQKLNRTKNHFPRYMYMGYYAGLVGGWPVYEFIKSIKELEGAENPHNKFVDKSMLAKYKIFAKNKSEAHAILWWNGLSTEEKEKFESYNGCPW